jgi:hypothetical protein
MIGLIIALIVFRDNTQIVYFIIGSLAGYMSNDGTNKIISSIPNIEIKEKQKPGPKKKTNK